MLPSMLPDRDELQACVRDSNTYTCDKNLSTYYAEADAPCEVQTYMKAGTNPKLRKRTDIIGTIMLLMITLVSGTLVIIIASIVSIIIWKIKKIKTKRRIEEMNREIQRRQDDAMLY